MRQQQATDLGTYEFCGIVTQFVFIWYYWMLTLSAASRWSYHRQPSSGVLYFTHNFSLFYKTSWAHNIAERKATAYSVP